MIGQYVPHMSSCLKQHPCFRHQSRHIRSVPRTLTLAHHKWEGPPWGNPVSQTKRPWIICSGGNWCITYKIALLFETQDGLSGTTHDCWPDPTRQFWQSIVHESRMFTLYLVQGHTPSRRAPRLEGLSHSTSDPRLKHARRSTQQDKKTLVTSSSGASTSTTMICGE